MAVFNRIASTPQSLYDIIMVAQVEEQYAIDTRPNDERREIR